MSVQYINGAWRANCENAQNPEEINYSINGSSIGKINSGTSWVDSGTSSTTVDYSGYYWRWDGIRWVYEPGWTWISPYIGWITYSNSDFKVLQWNGKTIIYRIINSEIEYAVVSSKSEISFQTTNSLETILKALN